MVLAKGKSRAGEYFCVKHLIENGKEFNLQTHMALIDFR